MKFRLSENISSEIHLANVGSGVDLDSPIKFSLLDFDNQVMVLNNVDQISIFPYNYSEASSRGVNTVPLNNGMAMFDAIQLVSEIGAKGIKYKISTNAIDSAKVSELYGSSTFTDQIIVDFRFCKPGEQVTGNTCTE